jgi:hypothetical protein
MSIRAIVNRQKQRLPKSTMGGLLVLSSIRPTWGLPPEKEGAEIWARRCLLRRLQARFSLFTFSSG